MDCRVVDEREILERYLLDRLTESEREEFEMHYFQCELCFSQLQTANAVQAELQHRSVKLAQPRSTLLRRAWALTPVFATLAGLLVAGIWWNAARKHQSPQQVSSSPRGASPALSGQPEPSSLPPASLAELARVEPPPYAPVVLRGAEDEAQESFHKAMQSYLERDYADAIPGLRAAAIASPRTASFTFYLGVCYLLTGQTEFAIKYLRHTVSLGDAAYSEEAHFYLAKAYLRKKDVSSAEGELQETIRFHGGVEADAEELLRQLRK